MKAPADLLVLLSADGAPLRSHVLLDDALHSLPLELPPPGQSPWLSGLHALEPGTISLSDLDGPLVIPAAGGSYHGAALRFGGNLLLALCTEPDRRIERLAQGATLLGEEMQQRAVRAEELLQSRLEQSLTREGLGLLIGDFAHQLNNHINTTLGNAEFAGMVADDPEELGTSLQAIETAGQQAARLVLHLLEASGRSERKGQALDLPELVDESLSLLAPAAPPGVELLVEHGPGLPRVQGHRSALQAVVVHLVVNSYEALAGRGGEVKVRTRLVDLDGERLRGMKTGSRTAPGSFLELTVVDDGPGISLGLRETLWEPFSTSREGHSGLGLAVALATARSHRGAIAVSSEPRQGCAVRVCLPVATSQTTDD